VEFLGHLTKRISNISRKRQWVENYLSVIILTKLCHPLKGREIILDRREDYHLSDFDKYWCIGGKKTYEKYCSQFTELHISRINDNTVGDTKYPDLSKLNPNCKIYEYNF